MTTQNIFDLSDTWNDGATTFSAIKMNVTDTASASGSLLMDLQVGGASRFKVQKDGTFYTSNGTRGFGITFYSLGYYLGNFTVYPAVEAAGGGNAGRISIRSGVSYGWSSSATDAAGTPDLTLFRDAADTLAQRRSTNPQAFRAYNTFTDLSNYERGKIAWESNVLRIGTEKAGTGSARALELQVDGTTYLTLNTGASPRHSFTGGNTQFSGNLTTGGDMTIAGADPYTWSGRSKMLSPSNGIIRLVNNANTDFDRLQFGGTTSSFPALKRSTTSLQARLADDSAFTNVQGKLTTETAYTAGAPTATGYLVLYDSAGVAYKVPAEAL